MLPRCSHNCSHLTRKRGIYYYRRRLPGTATREVAVSLFTRRYRLAEHRAARLDVLFARVAPNMPERTKVAEILRQELQRWIADDEAEWLRVPAGEPAYAHWAEDGDDVVQADIEATRGWLSEARGDALRRDFAGVEEAVDNIILRHGLSAKNRPEIAFGLIQVRIKMLEARLQRLASNGADILGDPAPPAVALPIAPQPTAEAAGSDTPLLSKLVPGFLEFMKDKELRGQTLAQNTTTLRMFKEVCGDKPIGTYTRRDTGAFYDLLKKLPAKWDKSREWRGLSLVEIVTKAEGRDDVSRLTMKTMKRHFSALGPLFDYAMQRGLFAGENNPAHGFDFPTKRNTPRARKAWDMARLKTLFASPVWTGCHPHFRSRPGTEIIKDARYWLPVLALFHGNRLEEFAQLRREDIDQEDGIWFFRLTDEDGRKLKNAQSKRRVPMHPTVIAMGFLKHVEENAPRPSDNVFPELRPGGKDGRLGFYVTKWWTEYRKEVGVYEKGQDYHALRHTVVTALFAASVPQSHIELIVGHAGQGMSAGKYRDADQVPLRVLYEAICKLDWSAVSPLFVPAHCPQGITVAEGPLLAMRR
jgi:integrase